MLAAVAPLAILAIALLVWIIRDILQSEVQHLPRWGWILVSVVSIPLGGIVYLLIGRKQQ